MLYFHIANRCRGFGILDNMRRFKNAYFYRLDINPYYNQAKSSLLYCIPKSVVPTCIRDIVEDQCGTMAADFVQNYIVHHQERLAQVLKSAGLDSDICDSYVTSDMVLSRPPIPSDHSNLGISRLLDITAPGTALATVRGKIIMEYLHSLPGEEFCTTDNAYIAYSACLMSSDDKIEMSKFNILQFAHRMFWFSYHGTQCSRLEEFTACWNLLQKICGLKVQGMEHHATLLVEGCKIQSELDIVRCHWQDMLLGYYLQASRVTVWPTVNQCLQNPMALEDSYYSSSTSICHDLDTVITLLQSGVDEIGRKCGLQPPNRIRILLNKVHYLQRDASKYSDLYMNNVVPT